MDNFKWSNFKEKSKKLINSSQFKGVALGQVLSLFIAGTGVCSQLLVTDYHASVPTTQSFLNYILLGFYLLLLLYYKISSWKDIKGRIVWYIIFSFADVEANYFVVKAYYYTTITSVMLLDCFTIPCVMILSRIFLKTKYRTTQFIGVGICLAGLIILVLSDYFFNPRQHAENPVLGDLLCLVASVFYAISNVGQEYLVRKYNRTEWLSMVGIWGSLICGVQLAIFERHEIATLSWSLPVVSLIIGFGLCLFALYSLTPSMIILSSATLFNLSLLTSDIYAIIVGIFLFDSKPSFLYFISFLVIIIGLALYNYEAKEVKDQEYQALAEDESQQNSVEDGNSK